MRNPTVDRIFNSDVYCIGNILSMDLSENYARRTMPEFQSSEDFHGDNMKYAVKILSERFWEFLQLRWILVWPLKQFQCFV